MKECVFKVRNLQKAYHKHQVLRGIDLDIMRGEILGLIGSSGSGKTTMLNCLIGFLKPDGGVVEALVEPQHRALGKPTYKDIVKHINEIKRMYGFASQIPSFYDNLTVRENLEYFGSLYSIPKRTIKTNAEILLHLMDLEPAQKMLAKNLSGGMERRLDIACALMHDPSILILDEPTADLDPVLRGHIYDLIRKINAKDTTIVLSSHHLTDIETVCDRIAILHEGLIIAIGTPAEIKNKFSSVKQVKLKYISQKYEKITQELEHHFGTKIGKITPKENELTILTPKPEEVVQKIIEFSAHIKEEIQILHMSKPSLDDIFISIVEGHTRGERGE